VKFSQEQGLKALKKAGDKVSLRCLNKRWQGSAYKYRWECLNCGHTFHATHNNVSRGKGCPECGKKRKRVSQTRYSIGDLIEAVGVRGKVLEKSYRGYHEPHKIRCECGYIWSPRFQQIVRGISWCPSCAGQEKGTIEEIQRLAKRKGGKCLSSKYVNNHSKLAFECGAGHQFKMSRAALISQDQWCKQCGKGVGEGSVRFILEKLFNKRFPSVWPEWLSEKGGGDQWSWMVTMKSLRIQFWKSTKPNALFVVINSSSCLAISIQGRDSNSRDAINAYTRSSRSKAESRGLVKVSESLNYLILSTS
jgi:DNA-directed RNA polymerase subunit RPC12/RpoP